jgi:hypothetical protein
MQPATRRPGERSVAQARGRGMRSGLLPLPLPLWERHRPPRAAVLRKDAEARLRLCRIGRCDPGEGLSSHDGPEPLTPPLSHKGRGSAPPLPLQINLISSCFSCAETQPHQDPMHNLWCEDRESTAPRQNDLSARPALGRCGDGIKLTRSAPYPLNCSRLAADQTDAHLVTAAAHLQNPLNC